MSSQGARCDFVDYLIEDVRQRRRELLASCENDFDALVFTVDPCREGQELVLRVVTTGDSCLIRDDEHEDASFVGPPDRLACALDPVKILRSVDPAAVDVQGPVAVEKQGRSPVATKNRRDFTPIGPRQQRIRSIMNPPPPAPLILPPRAPACSAP